MAGPARSAHADAPAGAAGVGLGGPDEPSTRLSEVEHRRAQSDSLFAASPLGWLREGTGDWKRALHDATGLNLAIVFAHVFQGMTDTSEGEDDAGTATTVNADFKLTPLSAELPK